MSWSLSSLGTFEKCAAKYDYKYIKKLPELSRSAAADRGVNLHKMVEDFVAGATDSLPAELSFYTQFLLGLRTHEIYPEHKVALDRNWELTDWDAKDLWYKGVLDLKLLERPEELTRGDCLLSGEPKGYGPEPTAAVVYDWKTGKIYPDHDDQKAIYSLAVFSEHPAVQRVRAIHVYLDLGKSREITYYRNEVQQLRELWEARVKRLENAAATEGYGYPPNPTFMCRYCSYSKFKGGPCRF